MENNDFQIIQKCQAGDLEKFGDLYDKYVKKIYDFVYYKTHHKETAEDITSQVFMKALDKIGGFDNAKGTMQAWLYQIARNTVIDHYRVSKSEINIEDAWDLAGNEDLIRDIDAVKKLEQIEAYVKSLKSEQRDIIIMRVWQEMSYAEIADVLGKSEAGCKMMFSRAINKLRQEMPLAAYIAFLLIK